MFECACAGHTVTSVMCADEKYHVMETGMGCWDSTAPKTEGPFFGKGWASRASERTATNAPESDVTAARTIERTNMVSALFLTGLVK